MTGTAGWRRTTAKVLGYTLFTVLAYVGFLWWLLPYPELARNAEARLRSHGVAAEIRGLGPGPFPGLQAARIRLSSLDGAQWSLDLGETRLRVPPSQLVRGRPLLELDTRTLGGQITARANLAHPDRIQARWTDLDLSRAVLPPDLREFPLEGRVEGELEADVDPDRLEELTGRVDASLVGVKLGPGKVMGFPVPEIVLGRGELKAVAEEGKVEVGAARFEEGDLGLEFKGSLLLRRSLSRSLVNGMLSLLPNEKAAQDLALVFAMFPSAQASDGRYTARVRGSLGNPRLLRR